VRTDKASSRRHAATVLGTASVVSASLLALPAAADAQEAKVDTRTAVSRLPEAVAGLAPAAQRAALPTEPARSGEGFVINRALKLRLAGSADRPQVSTESGSRYEDVLPATDLVSQLLNDGAREVITVKGSEAPRSFRFEVESDRDIQLSKTMDGGIMVRERGTGHYLGYVAAPWARDANGAPVPTAYRVEGRAIVQEVRHDRSGVAYPVVADPQVNCGLLACTVYFNILETNEIADSAGPATMLVAGCALVPGLLPVCLTTAGVFVASARYAQSQGACLAIQYTPGVATIPRTEYGAPYCTK
jgi:hypothetical protein